MKYAIVLCLFGLAYAANDFCQLQPETGLCKGYFPSYYYDPESGECRSFIYGGCQGNKNRFKTEEECLNACGAQKTNEAICHLEPETGMCLAYIPRYYYNAKERACVKFIYGGCQGNPNNFKTVEECEAKCAVHSSDVPICEQKPETGMCRGYFPRYNYDKDTGSCRVFVYGGCGGNENNFETEEECMQQCGARSDVPVCEQDPEPGMCLAYAKRFYFDKTSGKCKVFVYGGCGGNENRFATKEECQAMCQETSAQSVCELEADRGMCLGYFPRYHFNKESGECEKFIYGGCQGNANNFKTIQECEDSCRAY